MTDGELAELLRGVIARPDDLDVLQVYADVLIERGDPRGELIVVQLQRRVHDTAALIARERELCSVLDAGLVAQLDLPKTAFAWQRGFLEAIDFMPYGKRRSLTDALRLVGTLPAARMLRRIVIRFLEPGWGSPGPIVSALAKVAPQLRSLRELVLTLSPRSMDAVVSQRPLMIGELAALCRAVPRLEVLEVCAAGFATLRDLQAPALKRLVLEVPRGWAFDELARTSLPNLEEFEILAGTWSIDNLRGLFARELPVRSMMFRNKDAAVICAVARVLPAEPVFRQVRVLELRGASLDDEAIESLMRHVPRLRQLEHFGIEWTRGLPRLREALGDIVVVH